jgi:uncharacterized protein (UPF0332 family)
MTSSGEPHTTLISRFLAGLKKLDPHTQAAVILIGSVARNAATSNSDLDLLLIVPETIKVERTADRLHVQVMSEAEFMERLRTGDDFAAWCVRYGVPIVQAPVWDRIVQTTEAKSWPNWRHKIEHAGRRLLLADQLLRVGDIEAAAEELAYAVSHVARAMLLKKGVFPLSRPEMISQLKEQGYPQLGAILEDFSFDRRTERTVRQALRYVKKLLVYLDRAAFEAYIVARRNARKRKAERLSGVNTR